jgi:hypothetical protein
MVERKSQLESLGGVLETEFNSVQRQREQLVEDRWLEDERQYRGILEPGVEKNILPGRSKAVHRLTKVKVDTIKSRLMSHIFPANGARNWTIKQTPYPEIHPVILENEIRERAAAGKLNSDAITAAVRDVIKRELAVKARELMETQMADHLAEGEMSYPEQCGKVVFQGVKLGTGVLKGPLPERRPVMRYAPQQTEDGSVRWVQTEATELEYHPHREWVSTWRVYPDMADTDIRRARFVWQTHLMSKEEVRDLAKKPGFEAEIIREYLKNTPEGDATPYNFEQDLRQMGSKEVPLEFRERYRVKERWGYLTDEQLQTAGVNVPEGLRGSDLVACVWLLGGTAIKVVLAKSGHRRLPYYFFNVVEDDSTIFPEGVPHIMRHPARIISAALRMLLDNAACTAGPIIGMNRSALNPQLNPNPENVHGLRVYFFDDVRDMQEAMQVWNIDSHITELMSLIQFMSNFADETTTPRFMQGDGKVKGAGETASGLSMLMGAANVNLLDLVLFFDQQITQPFITALYDWEMQFNPRSEIKGDYAVLATGSASLVAKEVQAQQLLSFSQTTADPRYAGRVKDDVMLKKLSQSMDIDAEELVRTEEEYQQWQMQQAVLAAKAQLAAVVETMEAKGIPAKQVLEQALVQSMGGLQQVAGQTPGGVQ